MPKKLREVVRESVAKGPDEFCLRWAFDTICAYTDSTANEFATRLGVNPRTVRRWKSGDRRIPRAMVRAIDRFILENWRD